MYLAVGMVMMDIGLIQPDKKRSLVLVRISRLEVFTPLCPNGRSFDIVPRFSCMIVLETHPTKMLANRFHGWYLVSVTPIIPKLFVQFLKSYRLAL